MYLIIAHIIILFNSFISGQQMQQKIPDICDDFKLTAVYNIGPQISVLRGKWFWQFENFTNIGNPVQENVANSYTIAGFCITSIPECDHRSQSNSDCDHLRKAKFLKIVVDYKVKHKKHEYYVYHRIYGNHSYKDEAIINEQELPWNLDPFSPPISSIWPRNWLSHTQYGPVTYYSDYSELVFIVNGKNAKNSRLIWYNIRDAKNSLNWRSQHIEDDYIYIGIIEIKNGLYVIASKFISDQKLVFRIDHSKHLVYTCDFQDLLGCNSGKTCPLYNRENNAKSKVLLTPIIIISIIITVIAIVIVSIITAIVIFYRKIKSSKSVFKRKPSHTLTEITNNEDKDSIYTIHSITGETVEPVTVRSDK